MTQISEIASDPKFHAETQRRARAHPRAPSKPARRTASMGMEEDYARALRSPEASSPPVLTGGRDTHDLGSPDVLLRGVAIGDKRFQPSRSAIAECDGDSCAHARASHRSSSNGIPGWTLPARSIQYITMTKHH